MSKERFLSIDFLRAIAIIGVIVIHTFYYNLNNPINYFIWNYFNFVVAAFIFCSGFVTIIRYKNHFTGLHSILYWYKKRMIRLLLPFYLYLVFHYLLVFLFPDYFSGLGLQKNWLFFFQSVSLIGGISLNWLTLLFIELMLLSPLLILIWQRKKILSIYLPISFAITLFFTVTVFPYSYYRFVMWVPWSLVFILGVYFSSSDLKKRKYQMILIVNSLIFIILYLTWIYLKRPLNLIDNKYPPNFYHLSYSVLLTLLFFIVSKLSLLKNKVFSAVYVFISNQSYSLFFIHFIVLDFILQQKKNLLFLSNSWLQLFAVLSLSIFLVYLLNNLISNFKLKKTL